MIFYYSNRSIEDGPAYGQPTAPAAIADARAITSPYSGDRIPGAEIREE